MLLKWHSVHETIKTNNSLKFLINMILKLFTTSRVSGTVFPPPVPLTPMTWSLSHWLQVTSHPPTWLLDRCILKFVVVWVSLGTSEPTPRKSPRPLPRAPLLLPDLLVLLPPSFLGLFTNVIFPPAYWIELSMVQCCGWQSLWPTQRAQRAETYPACAVVKSDTGVWSSEDHW